jgi:hypothetical protein
MSKINTSATMCPNCRESQFEVVEGDITNSKFYLHYLRCSNCKAFLQAFLFNEYNLSSVTIGGMQEQYLNYKEAISFLQRSRSWIHNKLAIEFKPDMDVNAFLFKDADWIREGNRILFKKSSLQRIKGELRKAGDLYEERFLSK